MIVSYQQEDWKRKLILSKVQQNISMLDFEIRLFWKNGFERVYCWSHIAPRKLLRLSDGLKNQLLCQSNISRVQLKSKQSIDNSSIVYDQQALWKMHLMHNNFFLVASFLSSFVSKKLVFKEPLAHVMLLSRTFWDSQMVLQTDHFFYRIFGRSNSNPTE